jgi:GAF domain-containing protein
LSVSDSAAAEALAVEIARQQMIARQQTLVRQQLENNHFANMLRATANRNVLGGWRTDANGDEYYEEGYI